MTGERAKTSFHHRLCCCRECRKNGSNYQMFEYAPKTIMVPTEGDASHSVGANVASGGAQGGPFMVMVPDKNRPRADYEDSMYGETWSNSEPSIKSPTGRYKRLNDGYAQDPLMPQYRNNSNKRSNCCRFSWVGCGKCSISLILLLGAMVLTACVGVLYCVWSGPLNPNFNNHVESAYTHASMWWGKVFWRMAKNGTEAGAETEEPPIGQLNVNGTDPGGPNLNGTETPFPTSESHIPASTPNAVTDSGDPPGPSTDEGATEIPPSPSIGPDGKLGNELEGFSFEKDKPVEGRGEE